MTTEGNPYISGDKDGRFTPRQVAKSKQRGGEELYIEPDFTNYRRPDLTTGEKLAKAKEDAEKLKDYYDKAKKYGEKLAKWSANKIGKKPLPLGLAGDVFKEIIAPEDETPTTLPPIGYIPPPSTGPTRGPKFPTLPSICGGGPLNPNSFGGKHKPGAVVVELRMRQLKNAYVPTSEEEWIELGIHQAYFPDGFSGRVGSYTYAVTMNKPARNLSRTTITGDRIQIIDRVIGDYCVVGTKTPWPSWILVWSYTSFSQTGFYDSGKKTGPGLTAQVVCIVPFGPEEREPTQKPLNYDREDEGMPCQWQKDEVAYELPKLKIGSKEIGGNSINIDDGLKPLAEYLCKSVEMMHKGMGLNLLDDKEFPVSLLNQGGAKVKPSSLAQLSQWQFDNVSSLVGLPIKNTLTNIEDQTSDIQFRSVQDCLSFMFHQQKESDTDLTVLEGYCSRIAQQLEAVTQICLRQHADIEMIIQELGFKYKIETEKRPSLYKLGMKADDETTGILELFKGGEVSYPVRKWDDEFDQRQIALRTNLYAEISARSFLQPKNTKDELPGLDARIKMTKANKEDWLEWVKTINEPEEGTYAGGTMPYIEEFTPGTKESKKIAAPASGLSLFMKPVVKGKKK